MSDIEEFGQDDELPDWADEVLEDEKKVDNDDPDAADDDSDDDGGDDEPAP